MAHDEETNWLDDAFDERKTAEEIERVKHSRRLGYILIIVFVILIAVFGFSCAGMMGALSTL